MKATEIIQKIVNLSEIRYPDAEVYLFGSQARGEARGDSDWDLLVLLNRAEVSFEEETGVIDAFYDIELVTGAAISPLIFSKKEWQEAYRFTPLFRNIAEEGIRLR